MKVAFVIFDGMTALDFIGIFDAITRLKKKGYLPDLSWDICAYTPSVHDDNGLGILPTRVKEPLTGYNMVVVPGGTITRQLIDDPVFIGWIKTAAPCPLKVSVCTGALLLGAAGFLQSKAAITHPSALDYLPRFGARVVNERIVDEGDVISAGGVTSSIDLGLYLCEKFAGREARERIAQQMDYPYYNFDALHRQGAQI